MATTLSAGDIGFALFNADSTETFAFVLLADVDATTTISFTDNGWLTSGALRRSEGILDWTSGAALAAGTVITIDTAARTADFGTVAAAEGSFNLSGGGDQILAFQGTADAPSFIGAINNFSAAGAWQAGSDDSNETDLPPGLVDGVSAVSVAHIDNVVYDGPTTGDVAALRAGLYDAANWTTGSNSTTQSFTGVFTIAGAGPDVTAPLIAALTPGDDAAGVDATAAITVAFNEAVALVDAAGVTLHRASDDAAVAAAVSLSGATVTITPDAALDPSADYYVLISGTAVEDLAGNAFAGLSDPAAFNFTTADPAGPSVIINEIHADPAGDLTGDANGDGVRSSSADEFVELLNISGVAQDLSGWTISDGAALRHTIPDGTILRAGQALVIFGGGTPTGDFGLSVVQTASSGALGLNNGGDTVTLLDAAAAEVDAVTYGSEGGANQSLTRTVDGDPDAGFVQHSTLDSALFSPGTSPDGTAFVDAQDLLSINELRVNGGASAGADFIELFGDAGLSLDGLTLLAISGEYAPGAIDAAFDLTGGSTDADGFFLLSDGSYGADAGDLTATLNLFGSPQSLLLVSGFTGTAGDDLDADDDGVLDATPWDAVIDAVSLVDGDANPDVSYGGTVVGPDGSFTPAGAYRTEDGGAEWAQLAYNDAALDTAGATNIQPAPELFIWEIQGSGAASAYAGTAATVTAVVTFLAPGLSGFFIQEEDADADGDAATSDGIFVFGDLTGLSVGDTVTVTGAVTEFFGNTQITPTEITNLGALSPLPTAATVEVRAQETEAQAQARYEAVEGMLVEVVAEAGEALTVTDNYNLGRYGQVDVSAGDRVQATQLYDAQTEAAQVAQQMEWNQGNRLVIDDASPVQNPDEIVLINDGFGGSYDITDPAGPTLRAGAEVAPITGVMQYSFSEYRVQVDGPLTVVDDNPREETAPDVGGDLKVASFNLLNFFTTLDDGSGTSGPGGLSPRGADTQEEYERQLAKILTALTELDADVIGLQELENNGFGAGSAIATLVAELNGIYGAGTWAFVDPTDDAGFVGTDAITTGIIYKTAAVSVLGADVLVFAEASADQTAADLGVTDLQRNRPTVAAAFEDANGASFTFAVSHFKSKGSSGLDAFDGSADANVDQGDGQGYWNQARTDAANELAAWLATDPFGTGNTDSLVVGDLNAYAMEDPVQAMEAAGYTDLAEAYLGPDAYSYFFSGEQGTLDYGFASAGLLDNITGAAEWHINSPEPSFLNYDTSFNDAAYLAPGPFAASDHDPLLIGLTLEAPMAEVLVGADVAATRGGFFAPALVTQTVEGEEVAQGVLGAWGRGRVLSEIDVTLTAAAGTGPVALVTTSPAGFGVRSSADSANLGAGRDGDPVQHLHNKRSINDSEVFIFTLDEGAYGDAGSGVLDLDGFAQVRAQFFSDGVLVDEALYGVGMGVALDPVERFDELRLSADYGYFCVEAFEFAREELLLG